MQKNKPIIQLSDHVKNKIESHRITSFSVSSEELNLSDNIDNDNDSLISISSQKLVRKRRSTYLTYQIQSQPFFTQNSRQTQLCQECLRRENLIQTEHQNLLRIQKENKHLSEQFRSLILLNQQYEEENIRLKQYLTKLNNHLQEYQMNFNLLRQKMISEKNKKSKQNIEDLQLKGLRNELQVYNQVITDKRREEQKQLDYFYQFRKK